MSIRFSGAAILLAAMGFALPAQADCLDDFFRSVGRDVKRRQCWPRPFVCPDRQSVREPLATQVANGWELQNLLADYHFQTGGVLSDSGRLKVLWVLNEAPEQHRIVYVHRALSPEETAARVTAVTELLAQNVLVGQDLPQVMETNRTAEGWPADRLDAIGKKFQAALPDPKLPAPSGNSTGGSSSGSSSGGSK